MRGRTGSEQLEFQQSKDKTAARANSPSLSFLWTPRSIFLPGAPCFCGGCESSWTPCPPRQNLPDLPPAARKRPRGLRSSRSPWGGSSHLLLSFLFMLPGGEGGSYKSEARLLPLHHCSSFLAPWELGPPRCLGRKEELPLPTQPQARGKEEAGERPKVPPPPTWGSLQAEVSGAAGPHPQSPGGLSLSPPSFDLQTRDSLFCHCHASIKALFKENVPNMTHLCTHTQKQSLYFCKDILNV